MCVGLWLPHICVYIGMHTHMYMSAPPLPRAGRVHQVLRAWIESQQIDLLGCGGREIWRHREPGELSL